MGKVAEGLSGRASSIDPDNLAYRDQKKAPLKALFL